MGSRWKHSVVTNPAAKSFEGEYGHNAKVHVFLNKVEQAEVAVSEVDGTSCRFRAYRKNGEIEVIASDGRDFVAVAAGGSKVMSRRGAGQHLRVN